MNYFERCKKRIENAKYIEQEFDGISITYFTNDYLDITKVFLTDNDIRHSVTYKKVLIPLSENEKKDLFELCEKIHKEREDAKDKKILEEL
jgi:hypothetical protein